MTTETLAFLFTDIEGSTALLSRLGGASYGTALEDHHRIIRNSLEAFGGVEPGTQGDSFFAVFPSPTACVAAALQMQRDIGAHAGGGPMARICGCAWASTPARHPRNLPAWSGSRCTGRPGSPAVGHGGRSSCRPRRWHWSRTRFRPRTTLVDLAGPTT